MTIHCAKSHIIARFGGAEIQITVYRAVREMQNAELRMQNCGISCGNDLNSRQRRHLHSAFCIHHSAFNSDSCLLNSNLKIIEPGGTNRPARRTANFYLLRRQRIDK